MHMLLVLASREMGKPDAVVHTHMLLHIFQLLARQHALHEIQAAKIQVACWQEDLLLRAALLVKKRILLQACPFLAERKEARLQQASNPFHYESQHVQHGSSRVLV